MGRIWMMTTVLAALAAICSTALQAQIYKQVDENGNVTYTDQVPPDGSAPIALPELPVIETDTPPESPLDEEDAAASDAAAEDQLTPRELRRMYRDFRITRPQQDETFWGTGNMVVVSWGSSQALQDSMSVALYVDGQRRQTEGDNMLALTLDRGEHQVYAELLDARGRRVVTTGTVTFFVKQYSAQFNQSNTAPNSGS